MPARSLKNLERVLNPLDLGLSLNTCDFLRIVLYIMYVLSIESESSARAASTLNP